MTNRAVWVVKFCKDWTSVAPENRRPVRIIFGDADPSLNSDVARTFHEFLPGSELFLIPGARHFVQLDEPEQVARLILAMPGPGSTP
jgi:pimeloyl-ACP methyl ester carboxylesterase